MSRARNVTLVATFGRILRQVRIEAGWTQEQLAFEADIDRTFVGMLESGKRQPSLSVIFALAKALRVTPEVLIRKTNVLYSD
jgi:transcriptional regulator with XRE-family HTH domain